MRALRFEKAGSLDNLEVRDVPVPVPASGEALVQVKAAAINPSDVKSVLGKMHETTVPRTPGRDFAGIVIEGPEEWKGRQVFGSGGNLGFGRDGSHAEFVTVPLQAIFPIPLGLNFEQAAGIGVAYLTAWAAIVTAAAVQPGETALILGTTGAVGGAAARIAHSRGARVIGVVRKGTDIPAVGTIPVDGWIDLEKGDLPSGIRALTDGRGAEVVFDVVGGPMFEPCLASLARRGRLIAIASNPDPRVALNLVDFYHNESRLMGVDSLKLSFEETAEILKQLSPGLESGLFPVPRAQAFPLAEGPRLYREIGAGTLRGKTVLVP